MRWVDAAHQFAGKPAIGECVVAVRGANWPARRCVGQSRRDGVPVERLVDGDRSINGVQPNLMRQQLRNGCVAFAVCCELRPILGDRRVVRQQATIDTDSNGNSRNALGGAEHQLQRMLGVGNRALGIEPTTPEINHLNTAVVGGHTRAEFFSVRKVGSECFAYWFPAGSNGSDDVGHAANIVRLAQ